ncbi:MAG: cation-transporting P-type ATPase [Nanoarchaeota archaeon]|nr:cation-transporting P-type ATPase [Nanoarchaeota archaeon]MBU1028122.1 cation-transporting P-type ATPase [Nanoarchaeota archaeon]
MNYRTKEVKNIKEPQTSGKGLNEAEAKKRLRKYGKNELKKSKKTSSVRLFISQFSSPLIIILILASLASWAIGFLPEQEPHLIDTILILIIVLVSGISGFVQDYKAEKTIEALQKIATPKTKVIRGGKELSILITQIVPGDVVLLNEGDVIPADCKIIDSFDLQIDESILTGESDAIIKKTNQEIFKGTFVNSGHAQALVLKIGMQTNIGNIAEKLQEMEDDETPFQREISSFSKKILFSVGAIILIIFFVSLMKYTLYESLLLAISLAVAAIPEGLPAILTLVLSIGAKVMAKKHSLIRKLNVVESIGAVDVICADKTGTLTKNEMSVTKLFLNNRVFDSDFIKIKDIEEFRLLLTCGGLCNNSRISYQNYKKVYLGDQTEIALKKIYDRFLKEKKYAKLKEISFTSERKIMSSIYKKDNKKIVFSKGAPEILIKRCTSILINGKIMELTKELVRDILNKNNEFASQELRVLGFAYKETSEKNFEKTAEKNLIWLGLQAMIDPPRKEVKQAIKECYTAGIRVIVLTGDNPATAKAIANGVGLKNKGIMTGLELDKLNDNQLEKKLDLGINIFARISPFHKLRILNILKKKYRVAMTGDGVNDALALKKADVGISVGSGQEVAKEASDIILLDDNFASIVSAVKEGRRSFDNIRKFINYLFVCNLAEIGVLFFATLFLTLKEPLLLPVQILWINLLTDGMPALALGLDPARPNIMKDPPRKKNESIINRKLAWIIGTIGFKKMIILFATFIIVNYFFGIEQARTALFTGFILYEFVRIGTIRSQEKLTWFSNKWLLGALIGSLALQCLIVYTPISSFFHIAPLNIYSWIVLLIGVIVAYVLAIRITKIIDKFIKD